MAYIPNFREKQELKKKARIASGLVSERLPEVANIVLHMTYYQRTAGPVLMKRTVNYLPGDYAWFHMDCLHEGCVNGGFDLASVITGLIKKRRTSVKGVISCHGKSDRLDSGHANIAYDISIVYSRQAQ